MAKVWCVPGAPLANGAGWRIWYAHPGHGDFAALPIRVRKGLAGSPVPVTQEQVILGELKGFSRRIAIVTVRLAHPEPDRMFAVTIPELGEQSYLWRAMPAQIPEEGISFIFSSCFWQNDDKEGFFRRAVLSALDFEHPRPAFKLLLGDQIYLDFPIPTALWKGAHALVGEYYSRYWGDEAYRGALMTTPNFFMCDDHEFWNDYPERQRHLPHTYTGKWRERYGEAADGYYRCFQRQLNPDGDRRTWIQFDLPPASFFIADTRSRRSRMDAPDGPYFLPEEQWNALEEWQFGLTGPGILVLAQPLFQELGNWKDHSLSNFTENFGRLVNLIERSLRGENREGRPHDILMLSGDIHTGRHARASIENLPGREVHELIASPASRVFPFLSEPKPEEPPARIQAVYRDGTGVRNLDWDIASQGLWSTVDNNLGVVRLHPSEKASHVLRVHFSSYLVRPYRQPAWKVWAGGEGVDFGDRNRLRLNKGGVEFHLI
jgi:hypothetical protein